MKNEKIKRAYDNLTAPPEARERILSHLIQANSLAENRKYAGAIRQTSSKKKSFWARYKLQSIAALIILCVSIFTLSVLIRSGSFDGLFSIGMNKSAKPDVTEPYTAYETTQETIPYTAQEDPRSN